MKIWTPPRVNQNRHQFPNESRIARWFGEAMLKMLQQAAAGCGCPVPIMYTPDGSAVYAHKDVGFFGALQGGAFSSLSDLIAEATAGKQQNLYFQKVGTSSATGFANSLWRVGNLPAAAAAASALAAGDHLTSASAGGLGQADPAGGDTLHLTTMHAVSSVANQLLMLYDRLWQGLIALGDSSAQTCTLTGYPNSTGRYSDATGAKGNFAFVANEGGPTLTTGAHTWSLVYTDDAGNAAQAAAALAGVSAAVQNRIDHAGWFIPLLAGDYGIQDIESIQCSVNTIVAGGLTIVLAHPLALVPLIDAYSGVIIDGINSAFNLVEIETDACLALLEAMKGASTATTYGGKVIAVSG